MSGDPAMKRAGAGNRQGAEKSQESAATGPAADCARCPRLAAFRADNRRTHPDWFNAPVPSFGPLTARLLIVGLAPGLQGANRTGRPFTGDVAGILLYETLLAFDLARGEYGAAIDDGLSLHDCMITNAVRCVPPQNKPVGAEIRTCNGYLHALLEQMPRLHSVLALGRIAHEAVLTAAGQVKSRFPFSHGGCHQIETSRPFRLYDSYHCSRYNTNTGRLTPEMFRAVFRSILVDLAPPS